MKQIEGNVVDILNRKIYPGIIYVNADGIITKIEKSTAEYKHYIIPGFIDAHVHIESSMLLPVEFSQLVIQKGTIAIVNDPHEIANVLGKEGICFMIANSKRASIKTYFTIPSCVPSTPLDYSGACINAAEVEDLIKSDLFVGLSEVMNVPGVLQEEPDLIKKIELSIQHQLVVDGHAPALSGKGLEKYVNSGISTDHECVSLNEAIEKINKGMKILIREGSAAKNYENLKFLISLFPERVMFCTDDSHPDDIIKEGHIDKMVRRAISDGFDLFSVLKIACINPALHYGLDLGLLRVGDPADFVIVQNLQTFDVISVYINGNEKYNREMIPYEKYKTERRPEKWPNKFERNIIQHSDLVKAVQDKITCIKVLNHEIITEKKVFSVAMPVKNFQSDLNRDILKIVYLNRYQNSSPQVAFIHGVGLKKGAFASSISHDSHNIIAIGTNDSDLLQAINTVILEKGGLSVVENNSISILPLPIAGIMSDRTGTEVAKVWENLINRLKEMGCILDSPFMTMAFMALIVIPELKLGEKGLFQYSTFDFIAE